MVEHTRTHFLGFTRTCRILCSALVAGPLLHYVHSMARGEGSAAQFLVLNLLAPLAGFMLIANSLFCLFRYRTTASFWVSVVFMLVGIVGFLEAWYFLPQFRM